MKRILLGLALLLSNPVAADPAHIRQLGETAAHLRGLSYKPVKSKEVKQAEIGAYVQKSVDVEMKPVPTARREAMLRHVGLMTGDKGMKAVYKELLTDQIRGLYDPKKKLFLVVHGTATNLMERGVTALFAMRGLQMEDIFTVHEMEHAVQDQHFALEKIGTSVEADFDRELAAQSLIEGDATVVMFHFAFEKAPLKERDRDAAALCHYRMGATEDNPFAGSPALDRSPRFFREALTFPYLQGGAFVLSLRARGGWPAVDQAFRQLPESSEQILHPEKYGKDHPRKVALPAYNPGSGWKSLGQDTGGEFTIRVWAKNDGYDPEKVSGWSGDRYQVWSKGNGSVVLWDTYWDNPDAARFFEKIAVYGLSRKRSQRGWKELDPKTNEGVWSWKQNGLTTLCQRKGSRVRLSLDFPTGVNPPANL